MLIVDDFEIVPKRNMLFILRQIYDPAETRAVSECSALRARFTDLSSKLETGEISQADFHARGAKLLRSLQAIERLTALCGAAPDDHT